MRNARRPEPQLAPQRVHSPSPASTNVGPSTRRRSSQNHPGPSDRHRRDREVFYSSVPPKDILRALIETEHECARLQQQVEPLLERLKAESRRATEAERVATEATRHVKTLVDDKLAAVLDATKAKEELRLYQNQYALAQQSIDQAQAVLKNMQSRLDASEKEAARARTAARQLYQDRQIIEAREEGRQLGFEAGFSRARNEFQGGDRAEVLSIQGPAFENAPRQGVVYSRDYATGTETTRHADSLNYDSDDSTSTSRSSTPRGQPVPGPSNNVQRTHIPPPIRSPVSEQPPRFTQPFGFSMAPTSPAITEYHIEIPPAEVIERQQGNGPANPPRHNATPSLRGPPDNFIPLASPGGSIAMPPPSHMYAHSPAISVATTLPDTARSIQSKGKGRATESWYEGERAAQAGPSWYAGSVTSSHNAGHPDRQPRGHASFDSNTTALSRYDVLQHPETRKPTKHLSVINENPLSRQGSMQQGSRNAGSVHSLTRGASPAVPPKDPGLRKGIPSNLDILVSPSRLNSISKAKSL